MYSQHRVNWDQMDSMSVPSHFAFCRNVVSSGGVELRSREGMVG